MPSSHLILCRPLFLLPPIPPSIRVFSNESTLRMRWPKYWNFSFRIIHSKEHPGLISFRKDWLVTSKKDVLFIIGDWNAKVGIQETPGVTGKFGLGLWNEAGQRLNRVLPRECTAHSKHPLPTTQEKSLHMDITRWSTPKSD